MNAKNLFIAAASALAVACSGAGSHADLSVSAKAAAATPTTAGAVDLGNGILLNRVRVLVRKLKLEGSAAPADGGTVSDDASKSQARGSDSGSAGEGEGDDGATEMEKEHDDANEPVLGPLLADFSAATLAGGIEQLFQGVVPQGTFHELKLAIGPIGADQAGSNAALAEMAAQHASLIIDGTVDGAPFSFVSSLVAEVDLESEVAVSGDKSNNVTLSIDPKAWFGGSGTARLDPADPTNKSAIESNIKASIDGFEDDERNGQDDRGGHGDGGR